MKNYGFTLIELLIVVAIIGVLAAIAVPNFLNAQIRAKVSRAVSDMKTLETSFEMYRVDNGIIPSAMGSKTRTGDSLPTQVRFYRLTTPVSYLSSIPADPFASYANQDQWDTFGYSYDYIEIADPESTYNPWGHEFRINSWGPDGWNDYAGNRISGMNRNLQGACPNGVPLFVYQTTNGLTSFGDIVWVSVKGGKGQYKDLYCPITNGV